MEIIAFLQYLAFLCPWILLFSFNIWCSVMVYYLIQSKYYYIIFIYALWMYFDRETPNRGGRQMWLRNISFWKYATKYIPVSLHKTCDLSTDKNYIFGCHPHGLFSYGLALTTALDSRQFEQLFPGVTLRSIAHSTVFWFPIFREICLFLGICGSSKESIEYIVSKLGDGNAVTLTIVGLTEFLDAHPHKMKLTLKNRKGFVKIALKHGVSLVPCICFDENALFADSECKYKSIFKTIRRLSEQGSIPKLLHGVLFLTLWPLCNWRKIAKVFSPFETNRKPMHTIIGKPINVNKVECPSDDEIDKYHQLYVQSLTELFYANREQYASDVNTKLIIK